MLFRSDTAGITPTTDPVEQIGVQRSRAAAEAAEVVLLVCDGSEPLTEQDRQVSHELRAMGFGVREHSDEERRRELLIVVNKIDQPQRLELESVQQLWPGAISVCTSLLTGSGLPELEEALANLVLAGRATFGTEGLITSARHQAALRAAAEHMRAGLHSLEQGVPLDFVSIDLNVAYDALGEVTGETASADLLDKIFSEFCIGK